MSVFKNLSLMFLCSMFLSETPAKAQETDRITTLLGDIIQSLDFMYEKGVHVADKARVYVLRKSSQEALERFKAKPLHMETQYAIFNMYSRFKVSGPFFQFIQTGYNQETIDKLYKSFDLLKAELGLDDAPYMRIIAVNLNQILEQIQILARSPEVSEELKTKLNALIAPIGSAIAIANNGDRPSAFKEAAKIYSLIKELYEPLERELTSNQVLFVSYMEIVGVNEFLADFAEVGK